MSKLSTMKKVLALILVFVLTFGLFGCNEKDKANPQISNPDDVLASISDYSVTNKEVYNYLKSQYGATGLINLIDSKLLESEIKAVKDEDVKAAIDKDCYGEDVKDEEKAEKEKEFLDNMFISYSCNETSIYGESIMTQYRLSLAQKAYAKVVLTKEVNENEAEYAKYLKLSKEEQDKLVADYEALSDEEKAEAKKPVTSSYFADSKYQAKYAVDNYSTYKAIVVPFTTNRLANIALTQLGVKVNEDGVWADAITGTALTSVEVYNKFVELYNYVYGVNPDTEKAQSVSDLSKVNANVPAYLKDNLVKYDENSTNVNPKWYTANAYTMASGSLYVFMLKLDENIVKDYVDLSEEEKLTVRNKYIDELINDALTSNYCLTKMAEYRNEKNLVIYDSVIEKLYTTSVTALSVTFEATEEENTTLVAKLDGIEVSADSLFDFLVAHQGASGVIELLSQKRLLTDKNTNPYYVDGKWVNDDMKKKVLDTLDSEKKNFANGNYKDNGYDPSTMTWELYIKSAFNVENEEELKIALLSEIIASEYASSINVISTLKDKEFVVSNDDLQTSPVWTSMKAAMELEASKLFKADVIQLLVVKYENKASTTKVDPAEWTEEEKTKAAELCQQIYAYVNAVSGTYISKLKAIADAFSYAPLKNQEVAYNGNTVNVNLTDAETNTTIEVAKFKELGFSVVYSNNGTVTNDTSTSTYVNDATIAVIKGLWDKDLENGIIGKSDAKESEKVTIVAEPVVSEYGYHMLVKVQSLQVAYAHVESLESGKKYTYIPTLEEIRTYIKNSNDSSLTTSVKDAITKYYTPKATELGGEYFALIMKYNAVVNSLDKYTSSKVSKDDIKKYAELFNAYSFDEQIKNIDEQYIYVK